jgi:hypothetical protein
MTETSKLARVDLKWSVEDISNGFEKPWTRAFDVYMIVWVESGVLPVSVSDCISYFQPYGTGRRDRAPIAGYWLTNEVRSKGGHGKGAASIKDDGEKLLLNRRCVTRLVRIRS